MNILIAFQLGEVEVSNLTLIDETDAIIKVGAKVLKDGKKVRINKKTGKELTG